MSPMDEAQTLRLLGWTVGGVVGAVFLLNAIALLRDGEIMPSETPSALFLLFDEVPRGRRH